MMVVFGGLCFLFGVVYPVLAILVYPLYKLFGGDQDFCEYVRCL
jgi:hypothetical protein